MKYTKNTWGQLKATKSNELIKALLKDGFELDEEVRTERIYRHPDGRKVSIHYHSGSGCYGRNLLEGLLNDSGWTEERMRELKLIK